MKYKGNPVLVALWSWAKLLRNALIIATVIFLGLFLFQEKAKAFLSLPTWFHRGILGLLLIGFIKTSWGRWRGSLGLRNWYQCPPFWMMLLLAAALLCFTNKIDESTFLIPFGGSDAGDHIKTVNIAGLILIEVFTLLFTVSIIFLVIRPILSLLKSKILHQRKSVPLPERAMKSLSYPEIIDWVKTDEPIQHPDQDIFGHALIAKRMARRIISSIGKPPTQALVGQLGSGKTVIMELVRLELERNKARFRYLNISLWEYSTTEAAVIGVINALIESLGSDTNILDLKGVPTEYLEAANAVNGTLGALLKILLGNQNSPFQALEAIGERISSLNLHYVVCIEDLERFAGSSSLYRDGEENDHETERLNPIRALLYGLDRLPSISVIVATTSLNKRFDIEKIARFTERITKMDENILHGLLQNFRAGALQADLIDPADPEVRNKLSGMDPRSRTRLSMMLDGEKYTDIEKALFSLAGTPRSLKFGLRRCIDFWNIYKGEIDFDDLLVMCFVREAEPDLFALIEDNIDSLRFEKGSDAHTAAKKEFEKQMKNAKLHSINQSEAGKIIEFIFDVDSRENPQGISQNSHADYWARFLSELEIPPKDSDQHALRMIASNDEEGLLGLLNTEQGSRSIENFQKMITDKNIKNLLVPLIDMYANQDPSGQQEPPEGFIVFWRIILSRKRSESISLNDVVALVKECIKSVIPKNLQLASHLKYYFIDAFRNQPGNDLMSTTSENRRGEVTEFLIEALRTSFSGKPEILGEAFAKSDPWNLFQLLYELDSKDSKSLKRLPFTKWDEFRETIVQAAKSKPEQMLPQIAGLLVEGVSRATDKGIRHEYEYSTPRAAELFGQSIGIVTEIFDKANISIWNDEPKTKAIIEAVKNRLTN